MEIKLKGIVSSGFGEGKFFTQLDWVVEQFLNKFGFKPFPGTLNLDVLESCRKDLADFSQGGGISIDPIDKSFCSAVCYEAIVNGKVKGAVVIPENTKHPFGKLEIMAPVKIKDTLEIKDGDVLTIILKK